MVGMYEWADGNTRDHGVYSHEAAYGRYEAEIKGFARNTGGQMRDGEGLGQGAYVCIPG